MLNLELYSISQLRNFALLIQQAQADKLDLSSLFEKIERHIKEKLNSSIKEEVYSFDNKHKNFKKRNRIENKKNQVKNKKNIICGVCNSPAIVQRVNISNCTNVGGPWKFVIGCTNKKCLHTEFVINLK